MIAQVWTSTTQPGGMSDEMRQFANAAITEARSLDGCEGVINLTDPATGEGMSINLFRDQAALDSFTEFSKAKIAEAEGKGANMGGSRVYTEVIAEL